MLCWSAIMGIIWGKNHIRCRYLLLVPIMKMFHLITYDPSGHGYYALGEKVGAAFSDGAKMK